MDLWIRSQDKKQLELVERVSIVHKTEKRSILDDTEIKEECYIFVNGKEFGEYKTEQRAIEVLDEIQEFINHFTYDYRCDRVYQMPADEGVKND